MRTLSGPVADQGALHGLLAEVTHLGLPSSCWSAMRASGVEGTREDSMLADGSYVDEYYAAKLLG